MGLGVSGYNRSTLGAILKKLFVALSLAFSTATAAAPAQGAVTVYKVEGTFQNNVGFSGSFSQDNQKLGRNQFSDVNIAVDGFPLVDWVGSLSLINTSQVYGISFSNYSVWLALQFNSASTNMDKLEGLILGPLEQYSFLYDYKNPGAVYIKNGTVSVIGNPAVPEPATWLLMLLGFGTVGYALRGKRAMRFI